MLIMNSIFDNMPIASIQAGQKVGNITGSVIDPEKLRIIAFYVQKPNSTKDYVLYPDDLTQLTSKGMVIDHDDLIMSNSDDLVRLKKYTDLNFRLIDMPVETESGRKVGKVSRYAVDGHGFIIMQLYVAQNMLLNLNNAEIIIHRNQITSVSQKVIVVKDASVKVGAKFGFRGFLFGRQKSAELKPESSRSKRN